MNCKGRIKIISFGFFLKKTEKNNEQTSINEHGFVFFDLMT